MANLSNRCDFHDVNNDRDFFLLISVYSNFYYNKNVQLSENVKAVSSSVVLRVISLYSIIIFFVNIIASIDLIGQ